MEVFTKIRDLKSRIKDIRAKKKTIGLVPTMGSLHEGHLSLVRQSIYKTDCTVVSLFVNPAQFGPNEDFKEYPRDLKRDTGMLEAEGVDILFHPGVEEIYPEDYKTYVEVSDLQDKLLGHSRPGHFRGVCTVVLKLLHIVGPDISFFGQKDAEQAVILKKMVHDLNLETKIDVLPTVRDPDGLALSSRNKYLTPEQRRSALSLSRSLITAQEMIDKGERNPDKIIRRIKEFIKLEPEIKIDYIDIVDKDNLNSLTKIERNALIILAVLVGDVRLIDNAFLDIME
jgi:pantoate--beta-alanine ligase